MQSTRKSERSETFKLSSSSLLRLDFNIVLMAQAFFVSLSTPLYTVENEPVTSFVHNFCHSDDLHELFISDQLEAN
jgi:spore germination protein GerM